MNNGKEQKSPRQLRTENIERIFKEVSDRQLMEEQTFLLKSTNKNLDSIRKNVQFLFYITIIGIILFIIYILSIAA